MTKSKIAPAGSYLERLQASGLMTEKNRDAILAVEEMAKNPLTAEQKRAQIAKGNPDLVRYGDPKSKDRD